MDAPEVMTGPVWSEGSCPDMFGGVEGHAACYSGRWSIVQLQVDSGVPMVRHTGWGCWWGKEPG